MKKLIIIGAILVTAALIVLFAHEGALTEAKTSGSKLMIISVVTGANKVFIEDEHGRRPELVEEDVIKEKAELIGKIYQYGESSCTVYCSGGYCWQFCW